MRAVVPASLLGASLVGLGVGRYALGRNEEGGAAFYQVAPLAFAIALVLLVFALRTADVRGKAVGALLVSALAFVFGWRSGTDDGEHSALFFAAAVALAFYGALHARRWNRNPGEGADAVAARTVAVAGIFLVTASIAIVALGIFLLVLFTQLDLA